MIQSMTGYARYEHKADWGTAVWEIRSVNQRYLETYFRLPENFRSLENTLREQFRKKLQRGKVECKLHLQMEDSKQSALSINEDLAKSVIASAKWVSQHSAAGQLNPVDVLKWPGVVAAQEQDMDTLQKELLGALDKATADFIENRTSEGAAIDKMLQERLDGVSQQVVFVRDRMPTVIEWQRERLLTRFEEA
ncbi:MAG: YicC/YloC family endoribonuclease, partial [Pseudomonadota bacterium]